MRNERGPGISIASFAKSPFLSITDARTPATPGLTRQSTLSSGRNSCALPAMTFFDVDDIHSFPASAVDEKRCLDWFFCMAEVNHQVVRSNGHRFDIRVQ